MSNALPSGQEVFVFVRWAGGFARGFHTRTSGETWKAFIHRVEGEYEAMGHKNVIAENFIILPSTKIPT